MKKINKNVGLSVSEGTQLPYVVFKGQGLYADYYEGEFKKHHANSRIVKDEALLEKLSRLPVTSEVSPDLYQLVAILLIYVYSLDNEKN